MGELLSFITGYNFHDDRQQHSDKQAVANERLEHLLSI